MTQHINILRSIVAGAAIGIFGCHQSSSPPVVATPVGATETPAKTTISEPVVKEDTTPEIEPKPVVAVGTFSFPDDASGKELAKILTPALPPAMPAATPVVPKERMLPEDLSAPTPAPGDASKSMPRLPLPTSAPSQPKPLPDRVPLDLGGAMTQLPPRSELATGPLTRLDRRDPSLPAELPFLSPQPVADRAPLTDPTLEFTAQSVISAVLPLRTLPTGFIRINLPDPFEHADAAKPRTPIVEDPNRVLPR